MQETLRHQQAFEYYYMLGPERSLGKVASKFNVSRPTVTLWSQKLNWPQRVVDRDNKNMQTIRERNDESVVADMESYRKIIRASVGDYIKRLKDGLVKIDNVNDFTRLVKLDMELCGYMEQVEKEEKDKNNDDNTITFTFNGDDKDENN